MGHIFFYELMKLCSGSRRQEFIELEMIRHFRRTGSILPYPPFIVQFQTQSACNGRCIFCPYPELSGRLDQGKMDWSLFQKIADEIVQWKGIGSVMLMLQNEPFMDKDFSESINYFKRKKPEVKIATVTNGSILHASILEKVARSGLDELTISLDAFSKETYEVLHPGFSFEKLMEGIKRAMQQKPRGLSIRLSFVSTNINYHELPDFIKFAKHIGAQWRSIGFFNRADNLKAYERMRLRAYQWHALKSKLTYKYFYRTCPFPFARMSVLFNGDVIICCHDWHRNVKIGNAGTQSLHEIWGGKKFNALRKDILNRQYQKISSCRRCSIAQLSM
jgi:radical SAM protein with 4Fe4S-binding SPASM domain